MVDLRPYEFLKNKKNFKAKKHSDLIIRRTRIICFLILISVHVLDVISTVIGLSLGAYETNPVTSHFVYLGLWPFALLSGALFMVIIISVFIFIDFIVWLFKKITYKNMSMQLTCLFYIVFAMTLSVRIILAIINNIRIITILA